MSAKISLLMFLRPQQKFKRDKGATGFLSVNLQDGPKVSQDTFGMRTRAGHGWCAFFQNTHWDQRPREVAAFLRATVTHRASSPVIQLDSSPHKKQPVGWPAPVCLSQNLLTSQATMLAHSVLQLKLTLQGADPGPSGFLPKSPRCVPIATRPRQRLPNMQVVSHGTPGEGRPEYAFYNEKDLKN